MALYGTDWWLQQNMTLKVCSANAWKTWTMAGLALVFGGALEAQTLEVAPFVSYMRMGRAPLGSISPDNPADTDTRIGNSRGYGVHLTWNPWNYYGHEISYTRYDPLVKTTIHPADTTTGQDQVLSQKIQLHTLTYNFMMYFMPKGERWRPYATAGLLANQYQRPRFENFPTGRTRHYGGNYGAGVKIKLMPHVLARFDFRHYIGGKPYDLTYDDPLKSGGFLQQLEGSFGIGFTF